MSDTEFFAILIPNEGDLKVSLKQNVYKVPINGNSLPVTVKLNKAPAEDMKIYYKTTKPPQNEFVKFQPEFILIKAGETEASFDFKTLEGSISGLIELIVEPLSLIHI